MGLSKMPIKRNKTKENEELQKFKTVATLIVAPKYVTENAVKMFVKTEEVDSLVSLEFQDVADQSRLVKFIPHYKLKKAKKLYKKAKIQAGYLHKFLMRGRPDIVGALNNLPEDYRLICQVECPRKDIKKYKNIDIGFTSNGKYESKDKTLMGCAIRETLEEARIKLKEQIFCPIFQSSQREKLNIDDLPLNFSYSHTFCYILVL